MDYPWDEWFDGQGHKLIKGKDFDGSMMEFCDLLVARAWETHYFIRWRWVDDGIYFMANEIPEITDAHP
jgi:hypothetical protein